MAWARDWFRPDETAAVRVAEGAGRPALGVSTSLEAGYAAAHDGAVVYDSSSFGRLRLTGKSGASGVLADVIVARADPIAGDGFHLLAEAEALSPLWQAAIEIGATPVGEQTMEVLRIESGRPRYAHELSENYIALEVGLQADISFTKGCYIGQEIIARMESRQRLAKKMVGLRSSEPIESAAKIWLEGASVGQVTSAAVRPNGGQADAESSACERIGACGIALGFVKTPHATAGTTVSIGAEPAIDAEIVTFPIP